MIGDPGLPIWERSCDHGLTRHGLASFGKFKSQKLIIRLFPKVIPICSTLFSHSVSNADLIESEALFSPTGVHGYVSALLAMAGDSLCG